MYRQFILAAALGLASAFATSCSQSSNSRLAEMDKRLSAVEAAQREASKTGAWILWQHRRVVATPPGTFAGPAPAIPTDAFGSKDQCLAGAWTIAKQHGVSPPAPSATWFENSGQEVDRIYFTCLPKGVNPTF